MTCFFDVNSKDQVVVKIEPHMHATPNGRKGLTRNNMERSYEDLTDGRLNNFTTINKLESPQNYIVENSKATCNFLTVQFS